MNGDPAHRFVEVLPRQEAEGTHCIDCSSVLDPWEGQAGARDYAFNARDVGYALSLVATGTSYRQAALSTRLLAHRGRAGVTWGAKKPRKRQRLYDSQLVANWVDVLGPVASYEHGVSAWPEVLVVDSVQFRQGGQQPRSFHRAGAPPPSDAARHPSPIRPWPTA